MMTKDPFINDYIGNVEPTREKLIRHRVLKVNEVLKKFFKWKALCLIDFKIEFGRYHGEVILVDEISLILTFRGY